MNKESPATLFDALATDYESMRVSVGWSPFPHIEETLGTCDVKGLRVLDAGCGTGEVARWLAARGAHVVGLDIAFEMCLEAANRSENIPFLQHDLAVPLPYDDASFDVVIALGCLEYLDDIESVVGEFCRVLSDGGMFLGAVERCGDDCPGAMAEAVEMFDDWMRYRLPEAAIDLMARRYFCDLELCRTTGFRLEDTGEWTQYVRIFGKRPSRC